MILPRTLRILTPSAGHLTLVVQNRLLAASWSRRGTADPHAFHCQTGSGDRRSEVRIFVSSLSVYS